MIGLSWFGGGYTAHLALLQMNICEIIQQNNIKWHPQTKTIGRLKEHYDYENKIRLIRRIDESLLIIPQDVFITW